MEEVLQENMQIGSLRNQGHVAPKMNMDDVATYHSGKQEDLEVTIKKHKIGNLAFHYTGYVKNIRNQLLQ
jgi:hypothetical protein